ncbi:hypothetical protein SAMN05444159_0035 [Bradyrhizobium lablabi]|uniref:Uncharacterized protein n=1 Tax=Bradyrhizobium lablabi TaxID=722472 RepID=A0A1M6HKR4_9BRAD|nr:hypothetical protein SAMN05444159_0035 [Bradyrhizobium lablabi]
MPPRKQRSRDQQPELRPVDQQSEGVEGRADHRLLENDAW